MDKSLWEILVPKYSNENLEYEVEYHRKWDEQVRKIAGGVSIFKTLKGQWINDQGKLFVEQMIPVRIYCSEDEIDKIIDFTLEYYKQEAVLAYEISSKVKLKKKTD